MPLKITSTEKKPGVFIVSLIGSLDTNTAGMLDKRMTMLIESSPAMIILDMEHLEYISSIGISSILRTKKALKKTNGKLNLLNLQPQIRKVFDIINALPSQRIFTSVEELDQYLDKMQRAVSDTPHGST